MQKLFMPANPLRKHRFFENKNVELRLPFTWLQLVLAAINGQMTPSFPFHISKDTDVVFASGVLGNRKLFPIALDSSLLIKIYK
jgi:hypothetical protein